MIRFASLWSAPRTLGRCVHLRNRAIDLRFKSTTAAHVAADTSGLNTRSTEIQRLRHMRNVGIFAHVDAGKTTVTERMLALAGIVKQAGSVDDGNTVTDYLPAERERGITIQSAAIAFEWGWHNNRTGDDYEANDNVTISLIDTPGHVDFSVEVNRSVAVLDGAVLVVDAVAGVQAQTETVWRAMTRRSLNNHNTSTHQDHAHEPLPCLALINKMDKEGCHFGNAIQSIKQKLPGANPIPVQVPLFRTTSSSSNLLQNLVAVPVENETMANGEFAGVIDLMHMRAIVWPNAAGNIAHVEHCVPDIIPLVQPGSREPLDPNCSLTKEAIEARSEFIEAMAECDERIEEYYLNEQEPSNAELRYALRRAVLSQRALPVMASAALKGRGVEPVLDAIADLLPSPLDRMPPALISLEGGSETAKADELPAKRKVTLGHALHPSLLALAFKVVHMKGRGGSGEGRVVFARVYSGEIRDRDVVQAVSPSAPGEAPEKPRTERIGGMLELWGGRFGNLHNGVCRSGEVCALVGLKSVVTGDTIVLNADRTPTSNKSKKNRKKNEVVCLAGVESPKPVLKVRLEAESTEQQHRLSEALRLLAVEDPSLVVDETESATLLSGLGELHIEVTLDRLQREYGLRVMVGDPSVTYRETVTQTIETDGLVNYDRTVGGTRLQASVHLILEPLALDPSAESACTLLAEPVVTVGAKAREFLHLDEETAEEDQLHRSEVFKALVQGCQGAMKRGPLGPYAMANVTCHVVDVDAEDGLAGLKAMPGSLRAAAANAISVALSDSRSSCTVLEPTMSVEVSAPNDMVGTVLSDLTGRRGNVGDVLVGESEGATQSKAFIRGDVPLVEILGYANSLRSLTGGEGSFTAEYKGHSPC